MNTIDLITTTEKERMEEIAFILILAIERLYKKNTNNSHAKC